MMLQTLLVCAESMAEPEPDAVREMPANGLPAGGPGGGLSATS